MAEMKLAVLIAWAVLLLIFLALLAYRATVTRYEEDQLFLTEVEEGVEHKEQNVIYSKVHRLAPLIRVTGVLTGILTVAIIGYFVWDAITTLQAR